MDFLVPEMPAASSGPSVDGGVKAARATSAPSSNGSRKSFSTVLQSVRGEGERGDTGEADDTRSVNKSDDGSQSKEARGLSASSTRTERTDASASKGTDDNQTNDNENHTEVSKTDVEPDRQESHAASDVQGQEAAPIVVAGVPFQPAPEAIDQTEVRTEDEIHTEEKADGGGDAHPVEHDNEPSSGSSTSPLRSVATTDSPLTDSQPSAERSSPSMVGTPLPNLPEQKPDASTIQPTHESPVVQVTKQTPHVVADDTGTEAADRAEPQPMPLGSQPGSTLLHSDSVVRRAFHAYLGAVSSNGKAETPNPDAVKLDDVSDNHAGSTDVNWYGRPVGNHEGIGAKAIWTFPHGQQPSMDAGSQFNEMWAEQNGPQLEHVVTKLPQAAVADLQTTNGQSAGQGVAAVQSQPGSGPTAPSSTASLASPPPVIPTHDPAGQSVRLMTRSVVLDLAQPDLGHVNVRVAMMNDVVHTHMSADRPEVGQYLMNGQDRLQAAFQTNGLEMGQFRVDIDRQGAGRSFQQGQYQEQGHTWNQGSHGMEQEHGTDRLDDRRMSLHGLLNVVA